MLICYSGLPGSGKSAHAARDIRRALCGRVPRPVIANFRINMEVIPEERRRWFHYIANEDMSEGPIMEIALDYWQSDECPYTKIREDEILLVIDEAQISYNSRTYNQRGRLEFLQFLSQSRHYGIKVVLITQKITMIDKQMRDLIDMDYEHRRLSRIHWVMKPVEWLFGGCITLIIRRLYQDNERMGSDLERYTDKEFEIYDSYNYIVGKVNQPKKMVDVQSNRC